MAEEKSSGGGLVVLLLAGGAAFGGYEYFEHTKAEQASAARVLGSQSRGAESQAASDPPESASDQCLDALAGQCIEIPCTIEVATKIAVARDPVNGADIARDTLLEVCLNAHEGEAPKAWAAGLISRVKYRVVDGYRRSARFCKLTENEAGIQLFIHGTGDGKIEDDDLQAALCSMAPVERCVIEGRYYEALSDDALAQKCGAPSAAAVRKQLQRARGHLRTMLQPALPAAGSPARQGPKYPPAASGWPRQGQAAYPGAAPQEPGQLGGQQGHGAARQHERSPEYPSPSYAPPAGEYPSRAGSGRYDDE